MVDNLKVTTTLAVFTTNFNSLSCESNSFILHQIKIHYLHRLKTLIKSKTKLFVKKTFTAF